MPSDFTPVKPGLDCSMKSIVSNTVLIHRHWPICLLAAAFLHPSPHFLPSFLWFCLRCQYGQVFRILFKEYQNPYMLYVWINAIGELCPFTFFTETSLKPQKSGVCSNSGLDCVCVWVLPYRSAWKVLRHGDQKNTMILDRITVGAENDGGRELMTH